MIVVRSPQRKNEMIQVANDFQGDRKFKYSDPQKVKYKFRNLELQFDCDKDTEESAQILKYYLSKHPRFCTLFFGVYYVDEKGEYNYIF